MKMTPYSIKNILVTTDLSELSAVAFEHALTLALLTGAKVHLIHVVEDASKRPSKTSKKRTGASYRIREATLKRKMQEFLTEQGIDHKSLRLIVRRGHPHREVLRYTRDAKIDLVIIATHGRTGVAHMLMGSIAEKIVRLSPVPVLTVKPKAFVDELITQDDVEWDLHIHNP
ncbi:MAG: universal stress protein [Bacteroidota bacterium]|jgi:nucleotide-binding universal stress UspA family protein